MAPESEISWVVRREHRERTVDWYWGLSAVALGGALLSVFLGNVLLAIIIVLGAVSIGILASREPREHSVKIDTRGIVVDGTRYVYEAVHSFWVERDAPRPRLFVSLKGIIASHLSFELEDEAQGNRVREFLKHHAAEEEQGPHVGEHLAEIFGL